MRRRAALAAALAGAARAGQTGLKGIDCIADTACVFSDDANGQLCYYDLATGEASLLTADVGAPRDVQLSRDGTLVVASDWGRNAVAKITVATKKVATVSCLGEDRWTVDYDFVDDDGCDAATAPEGIALLSGGRYAAATLSETGQVALVDLDDGRHKGLLDPDDASSMGAASSGEKSALFAVDPLTGHFERAVATAPKPSEWFDVEALPSTGADVSAFVVLDRAAQGLYLLETASDYAGRQPGSFSLTLLAGSDEGKRGFADGYGAAARFDDLHALGAYDAESVVVADLGNGAVRRAWFAGDKKGKVKTLFSVDAAGCAATKADAADVDAVETVDAVATVAAASESLPAAVAKAAKREARYTFADFGAPVLLIAVFGAVVGLAAAANGRRRSAPVQNAPARPPRARRGREGREIRAREVVDVDDAGVAVAVALPDVGPQPRGDVVGQFAPRPERVRGDRRVREPPQALVASFREFAAGDDGAQSSLARSAALLPRVANGDFRKPASDEVHHVGRVAGSGVVFDASRSKGAGKPFEFKLGARAVVPAFEMATLQTSLGGTSRVRAPARYAYGDAEVPKLIPPNTDLIFDVTLVAIGDRVVEDDPPVVEQLEELPPWLAAIAPPPAPGVRELRQARRSRADVAALDHPRFRGAPPSFDAGDAADGAWTGTSDVSTTGLCVARDIGAAWEGRERWTWDELMESDWANEQWILAKLRAPLTPKEHLRDVAVVEMTLADYALYAMWTQCLDEDDDVPDARKDALPRFYVNGWEAFERLEAQRPLFEPHPPCVSDLTLELLSQTELATNKMIFGDKLKTVEAMSRSAADASSRRLVKVFVGCGGSATRLHFDNAGAHAWLSMVRGSKLYVAYAPSDAPYLYAEGSHSPVDPLAPYAETVAAYPDYAKATPYAVVLREGETILVPSGWWHYAVSPEPSLTVMRNFWNNSNIGAFTDMSKEQLKKKVEVLRSKGMLRAAAPNDDARLAAAATPPTIAG
ncbi:tRNA-Phe hydroxylase [Aureococcus anophagefferens]|nr:tRNA-Phe hydroxylase [Aureococcus anophagefferens]